MSLSPFFTVHSDLPREGPGTAQDVHWAVDLAGVGGAERVLDAASGPGADTVTLAQACPNAQILAIDKQAHFIEEVSRRTKVFEGRVQPQQGDYTNISGAFDFIWCAGAVYFVGIEAALAAWRPHLAQGAAVAFSEPAWTSDTPSDVARAFWADYPGMSDLATLTSRIDAAGWRILGQRWVGHAGWSAYYEPKAKRLAMLRAQGVDDAVLDVIENSEREIGMWRQSPEDIDYRLFVVSPK